MHVQYSFICEAATVSIDGKLNVLGIFNSIFSDEFPVDVHRLMIVMSCSGEASEFGLHDIEIRLLGEDGQDHVDKLNLEVEIPADGGNANLIGEYNSLKFDNAGSYSFEFSADGTYLTSLPLEVVIGDGINQNIH